MIYVNSVNVYPGRIAIKTGEWYHNVRAEVCPSDAQRPCVTWSSSDPQHCHCSPHQRIYPRRPSGHGYYLRHSY